MTPRLKSPLLGSTLVCLLLILISAAALVMADQPAGSRQIPEPTE